MNIPRTFCVTLQETPLRTKMFLEMANKFNIQVDLFYGVFGQRMGLTPKLPNEIECPGKNIFMTDGAVGCYLSHFVLWNVLSYLPEDEFLIVEDDAVFADNFQEKFINTYKKLPKDWDLVYVGWVPCGNVPPPVIVDEGISIRHPSATHGYLIKKRIIKKVINSIQPCGSPIDLVMVNKLLPHIKFYTFDPPLINQRSYLNFTDPIWSSLVYDWENDLYKCKKKLLEKISYGDGWYSIERTKDEMWKWSEDSFSLLIPDSLDSIQLEFSVAKSNTITFHGSEVNKVFVFPGINKVSIPCKNITCVKGKVSNLFVPKNETTNSLDDRSLGICLKKVIMTMGINEIDIPIDDIV